ncbi:MAG: LysR family transcriptional regulator [Rhodanobacteraceae bacterium]|jgi:DNA-binding transcriptional LysR family regulator|uniref:substrate-binding domain-containing protein n=1 Tax=Luteimonas huabeiensis TaxID=1244513 RepID=UPI00046330A9|nr:substrate-binding domain-containing protein [Luteimonas huabeiensis]MBS0292677.1 substrate-binding domain-containing protein [Pseudomonadota bacterium]NCT67289.1 LysR family transcriptional regulator [Rhodanobacteraceae bacterium]
MHDATSHFPVFRLAIAPGVPSPHLSALLALHRAEEPETTITFHEVTSEALVAGLLHEGRYDAGLSLDNPTHVSLKSQALWTESMAVVMPVRFPLLDQAMLTIADLRNYPVYRWQVEACSLLDERLASLTPVGQENIQRVTSFEMMALWIAAGYGVGLSAQSRIRPVPEWGLSMRPLADGPYDVVTYLQRPHAQADSAAERFERRALQIARADAA